MLTGYARIRSALFVRSALALVTLPPYVADHAPLRYDRRVLFPADRKGQAMPHMQKLSPEEVRTLEYREKGQRKLIEEQYDAFLADYGPGDYGETNLEPDENRLTVRNRFGAAAQRRGLVLHFLRTNATLLRFRVGTNHEANVTPSFAAPADLPMVSSIEPPAIAAAEPPVPARKGRRKAHAAEPMAAEPPAPT